MIIMYTNTTSTETYHDFHLEIVQLRCVYMAFLSELKYRQNKIAIIRKLKTTQRNNPIQGLPNGLRWLAKRHLPKQGCIAPIFKR